MVQPLSSFHLSLIYTRMLSLAGAITRSVSCGLLALFLCEATIFMTKSCNVIGLHSIVQQQ